MFIREKAESFAEFKKNYPAEEKVKLLRRLAEVTSFEEYFRKK